MKKIALAVLAVAGLAFAGDTMTANVSQSGNGTNGMTGAAPTLATDGVPTQSTRTSVTPKPFANKAMITVRAQSTHTITACPVQTYLRGYCYALDARGSGNSVWSQIGALDVTVDAGTGVNQSVLGVIDIPQAAQGCSRLYWNVENMTQSGTADAGADVQFQLFAPSTSP